MKTLIALLLGTGLVLVSHAAEPLPPKAHPDSSGWERMFTADLGNANFSPGAWRVEDGLLTASKDEMIWTRNDYENFAIDLEFKNCTNSNSGVMIYASDLKDWTPTSVEVQILDGWGSKWQQVAPTWKCGGIFGHLAPSKQVVKRPGEWNRMTIWAKSKMIYVMLNGELVTQCDLSQWTNAAKNPDGSPIPPWLSKPIATLPTKGKVGLQGKHGEATIYFRNVRIKALD